MEVVAQNIGAYHGQSSQHKREGEVNGESATFSDHQLVLGPCRMADAIVGFDKLAWGDSRVASDGIARWRR